MTDKELYEYLLGLLTVGDDIRWPLVQKSMDKFKALINKKYNNPTEEEVFKEFEENSWKYAKKPNNKILFEKYNQEYSSYDFILLNNTTKTYTGSFIDIKTHQLLTKLFKAWGWFNDK